MFHFGEINTVSVIKDQVCDTIKLTGHNEIQNYNATLKHLQFFI